MNSASNMPVQRDIPGNIARLLFRVGIIWAIILAPFAILSFLPVFSRGESLWPLGVYLLCGVGVWGGWYWRSQRQPPLRISAAFWIFSAVFNSAFIIVLVVTQSQWLNILIHDETAFYLWWWMAATLASMVAFAFEFTSRRITPQSANPDSVANS